MESEIAYYELTNSQAHWAELVGRFPKNVRSGGYPHFKSNSKDEEEFVRFCTERGIGRTRMKLVSYSGIGPTQHEFFFFRPRVADIDALSITKRNCDRGGGGTCFNGYEQVRRVVVTSKLSRMLDKFELSVCGRPGALFLITRRVRDLILTHGFSGIELHACLTEGTGYTESDADLNRNEKELADKAKYFQFRISATTHGPAHVGHCTALRRCDGCGAVDILVTDSGHHFHAGDLLVSDFQAYDQCHTENLGTLQLSGKVVLISAKALRCLLTAGVKGLKGPSWAGLPIRFHAVEVLSPGSVSSVN